MQLNVILHMLTDLCIWYWPIGDGTSELYYIATSPYIYIYIYNYTHDHEWHDIAICDWIYENVHSSHIHFFNFRDS